MKKETKINLSSIYVDFKQGGPNAGRLVVFISVAGCPVQCDYCDSKDTWISEAPVKLENIEQVLRINTRNFEKCKMIVITGGEPTCIEKGSFNALVDLCIEQKGYIVEIETSGFEFLRHPLNFYYLVSPNRTYFESNPNGYLKNLEKFASCSSGVFWNFVMGGREDLNFAKQLSEKFNITEEFAFVSPMGGVQNRLSENLLLCDKLSKLLGWRLTCRLKSIVETKKGGDDGKTGC